MAKASRTASGELLSGEIDGEFSVDMMNVLFGVGIRFFTCSDPACRSLHILIDHEDTPIVSCMTIPAEDVDEVAEKMLKTRNEILRRKGGFSS